MACHARQLYLSVARFRSFAFLCTLPQYEAGEQLPLVRQRIVIPIFLSVCCAADDDRAHIQYSQGGSAAHTPTAIRAGTHSVVGHLPRSGVATPSRRQVNTKFAELILLLLIQLTN